MNGALAASWIGGSAQIFCLDLLLSGDNAVLIALACRGLPARDVPRAIFFGTAGAILLRVVLTAITGVLITLPYLKLLCAIVLLVIAVNIAAGGAGGAERVEQDAEDEGWQGDVIGSAMVIVLADAIMSLDNIVALAAVSKGNFWFLAAGLALSIPLLVYGGSLLSGLLNTYPVLITLGGAILGWTAGNLASGDPAFADWISKQAPALIYVLPISGAIFVLVQQRIVKRERAPAGLPAAAPQNRKPPRRPATAAAGQKPPLMGSAVPAPSIGCERPKQGLALAGSAVLLPKAAPPTEREGTDDRVMLFGLIGLFLIVGLFIAVVLFMSAGSFHAGG
ncbi:YjbE family putative metal transport protein [Methylovirgula sp. HY1]|uniref:YjbE family putative metal transport protein n=1 Tax=Methylovirgula sp. HY1 TaxID=2822761 RepID=UPI001C5A8B13|nr:YjbE family putative metal transport protein [Methylovirgula sp. HY1]QXX76195.1 hypothetical protein MHY1_03033 [Methylovirgula sp. HY1]